MNRQVLAFSAMACALGVVTGGAQAKTYLIDEAESHYINCYHKVYVPARVLVNTRGVLVKAGSVDWEITGDYWNRVHNPPVYIETKRVVEGDHFTLEGAACPAS